MKSFELSMQDKQTLVAVARHAILRSLGEKVDMPVIPEILTREKRGIFVTLRHRRELRGCIGYVEPIESIAEAVRQLSVKAAFEDSRFAAVTHADMGSLSIEISLLSPLTPCSDISEIEVGRHGLVVEQDWHRGLLLPEVAIEAGWDATTFVQQCCRKAGLPVSAWKNHETRIFTFVSEHFSDAVADEE